MALRSKEITNTEDVIDSRDVIERIGELEMEANPNDDETQELLGLKKLAEEAEQYATNWKYEKTLIRESYFTEYCEDLVKDIGDMPKTIPSYIAIDWEKTANNLRVDYTEVDFDGVTYLIR